MPGYRAVAVSIAIVAGLGLVAGAIQYCEYGDDKVALALNCLSTVFAGALIAGAISRPDNE